MKSVRSKLTSVRLQQRAGIILLAANGYQNKDIGQMLSLGRVQVSRWRQRYGQARLAGIERDLTETRYMSQKLTAFGVELGRPEIVTIAQVAQAPQIAPAWDWVGQSAPDWPKGSPQTQSGKHINRRRYEQFGEKRHGYHLTVKYK